MVVEAFDAVIADFAMRSFGLACDLACPTVSRMVEIGLLVDHCTLMIVFLGVEDLSLVFV